MELDPVVEEAERRPEDLNEQQDAYNFMFGSSAAPSIDVDDAPGGDSVMETGMGSTSLTAAASTTKAQEKERRPPRFGWTLKR